MATNNSINAPNVANTLVQGTGSSSYGSIGYSATGGTSNIVARDASGNSATNNFISGSTAVTSASTTTVLTAASTRVQVLQGTQIQTFQLPNATTLSIGATFEFNNNSTGVLTVIDAASGPVCTVPSGGYGRVIALSVSTSAGAWDKHFLIPANGSYGTAGMAITGNLAVSNLTGVVIGNGASNMNALSLNDGQLVIGATAGAPLAANLTAGTGISIANAANSITISASSAVAESFVTDSGTATPSAGILNDVGSGSITTTGSGNTVTTALTGLTNHAVLVGAGTSTITKVGPTATAGQILQSAGSSADPAFSTATYPSTTTINQILYSSANNVVSGLATANDGVLTTGTTGIPVVTALASDGQLIIGSGSGAPTAATLTAGANITITNAANSITISADTSAQSVHYTNVNAAASPYTVLAADYYISVDSSAGAVTLNFPNAPSANRIWVIKDRTGSAATHNITITTPGGTVTFDGSTSFVMNTAYESVQLLANTTPTYEIY